MRELVTIIVPVYNVEEYVEECINSLIKQNYDNLEIILVDDGSTDSSGNICEQFKNKDNRIKVVHQNNGGLSAARNTGIKNATGNFYAFIDSDDFISENYIETLYKTLNAYDCDIAISNMVRIFENEEKTSFYSPTKNVEILSSNERFKTLNQPSVCNKLFRAELFKNVDFPIRKYYEDTFVYHKVLYNAKRVVYTGIDGYFYRCRLSSILGDNKFNNKYFDFIEAVEERCKFLIEKEINPYAYEACLSYYAAYSNAVKKIDKTKANEEKFKKASEGYNNIYQLLKKYKKQINLKQKIRLFLLRYYPGLHGKLY